MIPSNLQQPHSDPSLLRILATEPTAGLIEVVADSVPIKVITKKCEPFPAACHWHQSSDLLRRYPDSKQPLHDFFLKAFGPVGR
jgi:hypothetical protein